MGEQWNLRLRFFLFFLLIALGSIAALTATLVWAGQRLGPGALDPLVASGVVAGFVIVGLTAWVGLLFDENVAKPIQFVVRRVRDAVHADAFTPPDARAARYLGYLGPAVNEVIAALQTARSQVEEAVTYATAETQREKGRLEALVRDLQLGVVICNLDHQILLFNQHALRILHVSGDLGLGRPLFDVVSAEPFHHALERLDRRFAAGRHRYHDEGLSALVVCATADGRYTLQGRVSLIVDQQLAAPVGYVVVFDDVTQVLASHAKRDRILHEATQEMRRPAANLRAAVEMITTEEDLDDETRSAFEQVLLHETQNLMTRLQRLDEDGRDLLASAWPMSDVFSSTLLACLETRLASHKAIVTRGLGEPLWLYCDSLTIVELGRTLILRLAQSQRVDTFDLQATAAGLRVYLDIVWQGSIVPIGEIDRWLSEPLGQALGEITGRDVIQRHNTEVWCDSIGGGRVRLRVPLSRARREHQDAYAPAAPLPQRPEFYDFDLLSRLDAAVQDAPLRKLTYVVFDTETTGLSPSDGDEIISIAGVRIVNGRVLRGEIFDSFVNPRRNIPGVSTKIHGITNAMVADAPPVEVVLPRFQAFAKDAILVAHNAAFDMKFLALKEESCGARFDHPVLDTVLLAALVHGNQDSLTLDALAERYEIDLPAGERHTALGDSLATAEVLLRLIDVLRSAQIRTLRDALEASSKMAAIRRQQARY
ncbi:MAG: exonuclease domain-containing protein [Pseudomonadota bacterium]